MKCPIASQHYPSKEIVMPFRICLPKGNPPKLVCWDIPVLIVKDPDPDPDPFFSRVVKAIRLVFGPRPEPWAVGRLAQSGLRDDTVRDARILATIDALAEKLSPSVRTGIAQSVQSAANRLTLPEGGELTVAA
jgi:hypothetical protein